MLAIIACRYFRKKDHIKGTEIYKELWQKKEEGRERLVASDTCDTQSHRLAGRIYGTLHASGSLRGRCLGLFEFNPPICVSATLPLGILHHAFQAGKEHHPPFGISLLLRMG
jgi:hypothetical protein